MRLEQLLRSPALAEEFERLRVGLAARHVMVVAAQGGEGVTTVAALLASSLASQGPVLLAEGNLRKPALARELGLDGPGLLDWDLQGPLPTQAWPGCPQLQVLTAGRAGSETVPLATRLAAAAERARRDHAHVVWDTPPAARFPDLQALAAHNDGAVVVAEVDRSRIDSLQFLRDALQRARLPILGSVLNRSGRYWPRQPRTPAAADTPLR